VNFEKIRWALDTFDIGVYYRESAWAVGAGRLYRDVFSEYPLAANVLFGTVRAVAAAFENPEFGFLILWMASGLAAYAAAVRLAVTDRERRGVRTLLIWLAPAPLYFAAFRFDVFPALATFLMLFALRAERWRRAALWLGIAIALKGYALFLLPAIGVYVLQRRGLRAAVEFGAIAVTPFALGLALPLAFAGVRGMKMPYAYHSGRGFNGESTWDALSWLLGTDLERWTTHWPRLSQLLQIGGALAAAAMRPRAFTQLVRALLFALTAFLSVSTYYSPQYVLWLAPFAYFCADDAIASVAIAYGWLTYLYFPVAYDLSYGTTGGPLKPVLAIVTALRLALLARAARLATRAEPATVGAY